MTYCFIRVILPLKLAWTPTYRAPAGIPVGRRVRVIFARKEYVGVVSETGVRPDIQTERISAIESADTGLPDILESEIRLWQFIASYYLCSAGEVYKAAYPMMKVESEKAAAAASARAEESRRKMLASMQERLERLQGRLSKKEQELEGRHNAAVTARLQEGRDKILAEISATERAIADLRKAAQPCEVPPGAGRMEGDAVSAAQSGAADATGQGAETIAQSGVADATGPGAEDAVLAALRPGRPLLLVGGRRAAAYAAIAADAAARGLDTLILTPDFAFSDSLQSRLQPLLPDILVCNSRLTQVQRRKVADALRTPAARGRVVLGTRSALFLPYARLGAIIVDEEQDSSYKQTEPAPRYNGRDTAVAMAQMLGIPVLLGSACPSLESLHNARSGKYALLETPSEGRLEIIDVAAERRKNGMVGNFSRKLLARLSSTPGPVVLIRGWEKADELSEEIARLLPTRDVRVLTLPQAKHEGVSDAALVAILQADALVRGDDFRADEKALQAVRQIQGQTPLLVIQTAVPDRFDQGRDAAQLLQERKDFGLPPYRRLLDIIVTDPNPVRLSLLSRLLTESLPLPAMQIPAEGRVTLRLSLPKDRTLERTKRDVAGAVACFEKQRNYTGHIVIDVDPV